MSPTLVEATNRHHGPTRGFLPHLRHKFPSWMLRPPSRPGQRCYDAVMRALIATAAIAIGCSNRADDRPYHRAADDRTRRRFKLGDRQLSARLPADAVIAPNDLFP